MPFGEEFQPIYDDHIKSTAENLKLSIVRADDFFLGGTIVSDIWALMNGARVVIADCTGRNANVFYELGMAHTLGKDVILVTQESDNTPFDIRHLRHIEYKYTPRGMRQFENQLSGVLEDYFKLNKFSETSKHETTTDTTTPSTMSKKKRKKGTRNSRGPWLSVLDPREPGDLPYECKRCGAGGFFDRNEGPPDACPECGYDGL